MSTRWIAHHAEVLEAVAGFEEASFDAILSDVPYGFGNRQPTLDELLAYLQGTELDTGGDFMGKDWRVPSVKTWRELFRVLKPGGWALVYAGPRTVDLISIGMRAAGFEVRDVITFAWMFGTGFPKSQNASKAIDSAAGAEREVVGSKLGLPGVARNGGNQGHRPGYGETGGVPSTRHLDITAPATELAALWEGFGTALKPAFEPIILARKPLDGTLAENVALHGTGALDIDSSRISTDWSERPESWKRSGHSAKPGAEKIAAPPGNGIECHPGGRWPANVVFDEGAAGVLDSASSISRSNPGGHRYGIGYKADVSCDPTRTVSYPDVGGASRFFYVAKASREERDLGCESLPLRTSADTVEREEGSAGLNSPRAGAGRTSGARNYHPTVKPVDLNRWLAGLLLPPPREGAQRRILVPYAGSGSEMIGALLAGWDLVEGVEREPRPNVENADDFISILRARVHLAATNPRAFEPDAVRKPEKVDERQGSLFGRTA